MKFKQALAGGLAAILLSIGFAGCPSPIQPSPPKQDQPYESPSSGDNSQPSGQPTNPSATETKTGTTNGDGQVTFTDNSTLENVLIKVIDEQGSPVQNAKTTYWSGDGFRVYLVEDPSGKQLPSLGIYSHNSEHTIETGKSGDGFYKIATVDENSTSIGKVVETWKDKNDMNFSTYNYFKTINYDEYLKVKGRQAQVLDLIWKGVEVFTGKLLPAKPSEIVDHFMPEKKNPSQRWDVYTYNDGYGQSAFLTLIPSNIPKVNINTPVINGSKVKISWWGSDKDTYDQFTFLPDNKDLTKYLDGNTTSDLKYSYEILTSDARVYENYSWSDYSSETSWTVDIPDPGNYTLELKVKDEVDNIGHAFTGFSVASSPVTKTIEIQPGPEGKDASISYTLWPNGDKTYSGEGDGTLINLWTQSPYWFDKAVIQFPLGSIPLNATIKSAKMELYGGAFSNYYPPVKPHIILYKLNSPWNESTIKWDNGLNPQKFSEADVTPGTHWFNFDITSLVKQWVSSPNYGLEISTWDQNRFKFFTGDYTDDPALRPKLEVIYTTP